MTVKELIEKLKKFPEDMEVLNYEYFDVKEVYEDVYPYIFPETIPENEAKKTYVIIN